MRTTAVLGLFLALAGCSEPAPLVLQGQRDTGDPAVVAVRTGGNYYCTGTVVAPTFVLTAAHCFDHGGSTSVAFRSSKIFNGGSGWKPAKAVHVEPGWSRGQFEHDIALVELAAPVDVTPIPVNVDREAARRIDHVRMVGFGPTHTSSGDEGTKRSADVPVRPESAFFDTKPGTGACYGDSGGPSFATIDGTEKVVAVTSHTLHELCEKNGGRIVRTDQHRAFLAQYLDVPPPPAPPPPPPPPIAEKPSTPAMPSTPGTTAPIECTGSQALYVSNTSIVATKGPAVRASGSCSIVLVNVDIKAPIGIEASGSASVVMTGGSIDSETKAYTTSGSAAVSVVGARFTAGAAAVGPSSTLVRDTDRLGS